MESDHTSFPTGKRAVICQYGEDPMDAIDNHLVIEDQDAPDPTSLKAVDCLIAVKSAAVGWVELDHVEWSVPAHGGSSLHAWPRVLWRNHLGRQDRSRTWFSCRRRGHGRWFQNRTPRHLAKTRSTVGLRPTPLRIVTQQGADHVVCTHADHGGIDALRSRVKELTADRGVDVVYDGVGGPISAASLRCVDFGARYLIVGWAATPFVAKGKGQRGAPNANQLPTNLIMMKGLDVLGCPTVITTHRDASIRKQRLPIRFTGLRKVN